MEDNNGSSAQVKYTVKELLEEIRIDIQKIDNKLDKKADHDLVHELRMRVKLLEEITASTRGVSDFKRWTLPLFVFGGLGFIGAIIALATSFLGG